MNPEIKRRIEQLRRGEVPEEYQKSSFGVFPSNWNLYTVGECLQRVEKPVDVNPNELYTQIGIRSHGKGIFYKDPVIGSILGKKAVFWIEPNCFILNIVFAWEQAVAKTTLAEIGMIGSHRFPMYRSLNDTADIDYLIFYFLTKRGTDILEAASPGGAGRNRTLGQDRFLKSKIVLPSIGEQKRIASILTAQDKLIELKEKRLAEKQRQKKYLMQQLLTGKNRLPGFSTEWEKERLGNCSSMCSGGTPNTTNANYYGKTYTWVSIKDMSSAGKYIYSSERGLTEEGFLNCSAKLFPKGTILLAMYASIGECSIAQTTCCSSQAILGIEPNSRLNNEFLYYVLCHYKRKLKDLGQASSQSNLNKGIVQSIIVPIPKIEEQAAIAEVLSTADREIDLLRQDIEQEKQKKKALMQLLLTGIVRVTPCH